MKYLKVKSGFTLIEVVVVVAIIAILAAITVPSFFSSIESAKITADQVTINTLNKITPLYRINTSSYDPFQDQAKNNEELIKTLISEGYLEKEVKPQTKDASFIWLFEKETWSLSLENSNYYITTADGLYMVANRDGWLEGSYIGSSKKVVIPKSLGGKTIKEIGQDTFNGVKLVEVSFSSNTEVRAIQRRAFRNNQLTQIILPNSLEIIGDHAFRDNLDLKKIVIGSNVNIGDAAFGFSRTDNTFKEVYDKNSKSAGTYLLIDGIWVRQ